MACQISYTFSSLPLGFMDRIRANLFSFVWAFLWRHNLVDGRYHACFVMSKLVCFCVLLAVSWTRFPMEKLQTG